jgi:hypothetical protein
MQNRRRAVEKSLVAFFENYVETRRKLAKYYAILLPPLPSEVKYLQSKTGLATALRLRAVEQTAEAIAVLSPTRIEAARHWQSGGPASSLKALGPLDEHHSAVPDLMHMTTFMFLILRWVFIQTNTR